MPRCVVHVGHAKTATSYLQHCLHLNEAVLRRHGWWVPGDFTSLGFWDLRAMSVAGEVHSGNLSPMHVLLSEGPGDKVPAMRELLFRPAGMADGCNLLLSSELFFYYPNATADVIRAARAHGFAPEVIAYVARQDRSAIASYLQYVRNHGYAAGVVDFLLHDDHMQYCRYRRAMQRLSAAAPGTPITLRSFDRSFLLDGDIFRDFLQAIGCAAPVAECVRPRERSNEGLLLEQYELLRAAALLGRPDAAERLRRPGPELTEAQRARVQAFYYRPHVAKFLDQHYMRNNGDLLDRYMPHAEAAEREYWQHPAPTAAVSVQPDPEVVRSLREMAFG